MQLQINLLPWREQLRAEQKKHFLQLLGISLLCALLIIFLLHFNMAYLINKQTSKNQQLNQPLQLLSAKIKESELLQQQKQQLTLQLIAVHNLQNARLFSVCIFNALTQIVPESVVLDKIKREGNQVVLFGKAESSAEVTALLNNVAASHCLKQAILQEIKTVPGRGLYRHEFVVVLK